MNDIKTIFNLFFAVILISLTSCNTRNRDHTPSFLQKETERLEYRKILQKIDSQKNTINDLIYSNSISLKCIEAVNFVLTDLEKEKTISNGKEWLSKSERIYCEENGRIKEQIIVVFKLNNARAEDAIGGKFPLLYYEVNAEIDTVVEAYVTHQELF